MTSSEQYPYAPAPDDVVEARIITILFGRMIMVWNQCESRLKEVASDLVGDGHFESKLRAKLLISELGSVGLTQALNCISLELPPPQEKLATSIRHATKMYETLRDYRNYFAHGLYDISKYGMLPSTEQINSDTPFTDSMYEGPFAYIIGHSAKSESKVILDFYTKNEMRNLLEEFERFLGFLSELTSYTSIMVRLHRSKMAPKPRRDTPPEPPQLPPMPKRLTKRAYGRQEGVGRGARKPEVSQAKKQQVK